ncbi:unnamed protein product [Rhodiola kirilowii]
MSGDETGAIASSPVGADPCPICLGPVKKEAYLDACFHVFCYRCIVQWMKIVSGRSSYQPSTLRCPMCKSENSCIIHSYDGRSFEKHYVNGFCEDRSFFSSSHKYRLQCYYSGPEDVFDVLRFWKFRKYSQPCRWLESWMTREIQALLQEKDVEVIVHHILGVIDSFSKARSRGADLHSHQRTSKMNSRHWCLARIQISKQSLTAARKQKKSYKAARHQHPSCISLMTTQMDRSEAIKKALHPAVSNC